MRPAVLRSAVASGGSTRRIKLDHNVGMDEVSFSLIELLNRIQIITTGKKERIPTLG